MIKDHSDEIIELYEREIGIDEIADKFHCSVRTIRKILMNTSHLRPEDEAVKLGGKRLSEVEKLSKEFGVSYRSANVLFRSGIIQEDQFCNIDIRHIKDTFAGVGRKTFVELEKLKKEGIPEHLKSKCSPPKVIYIDLNNLYQELFKEYYRVFDEVFTTKEKDICAARFYICDLDFSQDEVLNKYELTRDSYRYACSKISKKLVKYFFSEYDHSILKRQICAIFKEKRFVEILHEQFNEGMGKDEFSTYFALMSLLFRQDLSFLKLAHIGSKIFYRFSNIYKFSARQARYDLRWSNFKNNLFTPKIFQSISYTPLGNEQRFATGSTSVTGVYKSEKFGNIMYESNSEREFLKLIERINTIVGVIAQPAAINYFYNGKQRLYFPDFLLVNSDQQGLIVEVKSHSELLTIKNVKKYIQAIEFCRENGMGFLLVHLDKHIPQFADLENYEIPNEASSNFLATLREHETMYWNDIKPFFKQYGRIFSAYLLKIVYDLELEYSYRPFYIKMSKCESVSELKKCFSLNTSCK